jgi:hypothetical protein
VNSCDQTFDEVTPILPLFTSKCGKCRILQIRLIDNQVVVHARRVRAWHHGARVRFDELIATNEGLSCIVVHVRHVHAWHRGASMPLRAIHGTRRIKGDRASSCARETCARGIVASKSGSTNHAMVTANEGLSCIVVVARDVRAYHRGEQARFYYRCTECSETRVIVHRRARARRARVASCRASLELRSMH